MLSSSSQIDSASSISVNVLGIYRREFRLELLEESLSSRAGSKRICEICTRMSGFSTNLEREVVDIDAGIMEILDIDRMISFFGR